MPSSVAPTDLGERLREPASKRALRQVGDEVAPVARLSAREDRHHQIASRRMPHDPGIGIDRPPGAGLGVDLDAAHALGATRDPGGHVRLLPRVAAHAPTHGGRVLGAERAIGGEQGQQLHRARGGHGGAVAVLARATRQTAGHGAVAQELLFPFGDIPTVVGGIDAVEIVDPELLQPALDQQTTFAERRVGLGRQGRARLRAREPLEDPLRGLVAADADHRLERLVERGIDP